MAQISSCYGPIPLTLRLIGRDGGLSTLCHSCGFSCQQRVLKTFPGPGYLDSEDGVAFNTELHSRKINVPEYQYESCSDPFTVFARISFLITYLLNTIPESIHFHCT